MAKLYAGGCHCGAVRFEVKLEPGFAPDRCNCTICHKIGQTGVLLKPPAFRLLSGEEHLGRYEWGSRSATRYFCKHCGVHCYGAGHVPEIGGDFVSPNLNCLDDIDVNELEIVYYDGRQTAQMLMCRLVSTKLPLT